jgi:hypothetical protein
LCEIFGFHGSEDDDDDDDVLGFGAKTQNTIIIIIKTGCVLFAVWTECLNIIQTSFSFKGLESDSGVRRS